MEAGTEGRHSPAAALAVAPLEIERIFAAPRALVCEMWVKGENLAHWLPLAGHVLLACEGDAVVGGTRRLRLRAPIGETYGLTLVYREVAPPARLVFTHRWDGGVETTVSISFEALDSGHTRMVFRQSGFDTPESRQAHKDGWDASFGELTDHLGRYLAADAKLAPPGDVAPLVLTIERVFDAPRELVFRVWSSPEHIVRWWGPKGYRLGHCEMEFREGGAWRFAMQPRPDYQHWIHGVYREIRPPERLAFTYINDADGQEMLVELDFLAEGQKTRLKFRQAEFMSVLERNAHNGGWTETFDIVDIYLDLLQHGRLGPSPLGWRQGDVPGVPADLR